MKWKTEKRKVSDLIPYEYNPRQMSKKQNKDLTKSLEKFDLVEIPAINQDGVILAGHQRLRIMQALGRGEEEIDVRVPDRLLTEKEVQEYNIRSNKNTGEFDFDMLANAFETSDLLEWGFDEKDLKLQVDVEEDEIPEPPEEPTTKLGDLFQLGNHRLLCGDATRQEDFERLMDGKKADMVFTDPPYGMGKENDGVLNGNLNFDDLLIFNKQWVSLSVGHLKGNGSWYCWGIDEPLMDIYSNIFRPMIRQGRTTFRNLITWDKGAGQGQNSEICRMYATADEKCLFMMMGKQETNQNKDEFPEEWRGLLEYFIAEKDKMGWNTKKVKEIVGVTTANHWFTESQFTIPTKEQYMMLQSESGGKAFVRNYDDIERMHSSVMEEFYRSRAYFDNTHDNMNSVWHFDRTSQQEREGTGEHATPKPIALCMRGIKSSSREGEIVLDLFGGSGSTLIACEQLNRRCSMMELDPKYCDVIIKRWENLTGEKVVKL